MWRKRIRAESLPLCKKSQLEFFLKSSKLLYRLLLCHRVSYQGSSCTWKENFVCRCKSPEPHKQRSETVGKIGLEKTTQTMLEDVSSEPGTNKTVTIGIKPWAASLSQPPPLAAVTHSLSPTTTLHSSPLRCRLWKVAASKIDEFYIN